MRTLYLHGAHLAGTNLTGAKGLTQEQIDSAIGDATTKNLLGNKLSI
jgi:hypothetical protein